MNQVEMWKWFKLPVDLQRIVSDDKGDTVSVLKHSVLTTHHVEKMEIAINSYDENQALIAKQTEQIKMLRSTLIDTLAVVQGSISSTIANGVKALEATKEQA